MVGRSFRAVRAVAQLGLLCFLAGCSSSSPGGGLSGTGGSPGADGSTHPGSAVSFDGSKLTARIIARGVVPGDQQHVCVVLEMPNTTPVWVSDIHAVLTGGSHHLIVDRQPASTAVSPDPTPCLPTMATDSSRLFIAQQADSRLTLPVGTAFSLAAHQHVFLQLHYANVSTSVLDIEGTVELTLATGTGTPIEVKSIFDGSYQISIPPNAPGTATYFVTPVPTVGARHIIALTSHTHHLGVRATIERVPNAAAPPTTPIHESLSWSEPPLSIYAPPLAFTGADGLRLTCYYQNTTNQTVTFGTNIQNEMCFMWSYYYDQ